MTDLDLLAQETAHKFRLRNHRMTDDDEIALSQEIRSALEQAYNIGYVQRETDLRIVKDAIGRSQQPRGEWTVRFEDAGFGTLLEGGRVIATGGSQMLLGIAKHHNANINTPTEGQGFTTIRGPEGEFVSKLSSPPQSKTFAAVRRLA